MSIESSPSNNSEPEELDSSLEQESVDTPDGQEQLDTPVEQISARKRLEEYEKKAQKYQRFGNKVMKYLSSQTKEYLQNTAVDQEQNEETAFEDRQAEALIEQYENTFDLIKKSKQAQQDRFIVSHDQVNTLNEVRKELESGAAIIELDVRFDKDGKPWVSHSPRAGARFLFSKPIHESTSEEVEKIGKRMSLEDALSLVKEYNEDGNQSVVIEVKELGPTEEGRAKRLSNVGELLEKNGLKESAAFATLSQDLLGSIHDAFPDNSKFLNGGIMLGISCQIQNSKGDFFGKDLEIPIKFPGMELYITGKVEPPKHNDGYGKQSGYLYFGLSPKTVDILSGMNEKGKTGSASLTIVSKMAEVVRMVNPKAGDALLKKYTDKLRSMNIKPQAWVPTWRKEKGIENAGNIMGEDAVLYSNDRNIGDTAAKLPEKNNQ